MSPDPERVAAAARTSLDSVVEEWMARRGVVSVEVARLWLAGDPTDEVAIRVTVERKRPIDEVPDGERFPTQLDGIPVQLVEGRPSRLEPGGQPPT